MSVFYRARIFFRMIIAVVAYMFLFLLDNWPVGAGVEDRWDRLVNWATRRN
jgi:hypothetical protein